MQIGRLLHLVSAFLLLELIGVLVDVLVLLLRFWVVLELLTVLLVDEV